VTSVLSAWMFDPTVVAALLASGALYLRGVRRVRRPDRKLANRAACFLGGLAVIWVALQSPIDTYADTRLSVHMVQHLLLTMVAAALLVLGAPVTLALRASTPAFRRRWLLPLLRSRPVRLLTAPQVAWAQFALVLWASHFSPLYEAAVRNDGVHALEHLLYVASAVLFWSPVAGVDPSPKRLSHPARLLYLFLAMPQTSFLGLAMWGADRVLYPAYQAALGPATLDDQRLAGTIMGSAGMFVMVPALGLVLLDWLAREEREAARTDARLGVGVGAMPPSSSRSSRSSR
jgi:cytochrome c oxidase assembly factor CtaG